LDKKAKKRTSALFIKFQKQAEKAKKAAEILEK